MARLNAAAAGRQALLIRSNADVRELSMRHLLNARLSSHAFCIG